MSEFGIRRSQLARGRKPLGYVIRLAMLATLLATVGSCATWHRWRGDTPAPVAQAPVTRPPATTPSQLTPPPKPRRTVREARETKEPEKVASLDPKNLIGLQPAAVERLLGSPSNISTTDPSLVWTYAGQGCSFRVFFYPDLKTATFHALKYSSTANEQSDNACIRNILTVKSNGPS